MNFHLCAFHLLKSTFAAIQSQCFALTSYSVQEQQEHSTLYHHHLTLSASCSCLHQVEVFLSAELKLLYV